METENQKPKLVPRWSYGKILIIYILMAPVFIGGLMLTGFVHRSVSSYLSTTFTPTPKDGLQCFSSWDGSVSALVDAVKSSMNDPESFQHVRTGYNSRSGQFMSIAMEFRGRNGFGALILDKAVADLNKETCAVSNIRTGQ